MSSGSKRIRHAVVEGLKAANTLAGQNVFGNRIRALSKATKPALLVYTREERHELRNETPKVYANTLSLVIDAVDNATGDEPVDDRLDDLTEQVNRKLFRDPRFGFRDRQDDGFEMEGSVLASSELIVFERDGQGDKTPLACIRTTFTVTYLTEAVEGSSEGVWSFHGVDIEWTLTPGDALVDARDRVVLQGS